MQDLPPVIENQFLDPDNKTLRVKLASYVSGKQLKEIADRLKAQAYSLAVDFRSNSIRATVDQPMTAREFPMSLLIAIDEVIAKTRRAVDTMSGNSQELLVVNTGHPSYDDANGYYNVAPHLRS